MENTLKYARIAQSEKNLIDMHRRLQVRKLLLKQLTDLKQENKFNEKLLSYLEATMVRNHCDDDYLNEVYQSIKNFKDLQKSPDLIEKVNLNSILKQQLELNPYHLTSDNIQNFADETPSTIGDKTKIQFIFKNLLLMFLGIEASVIRYLIKFEISNEEPCILFEFETTAPMQPVDGQPDIFYFLAECTAEDQGLKLVTFKNLTTLTFKLYLFDSLRD